MSSALAMGLDTDIEVDKYTAWMTKKLMPIWRWFMDRSEAMNIVRFAAHEADGTWREGCGSNRRTWALRNARFHLLREVGFDLRSRKIKSLPNESLDPGHHHIENNSRHLDLSSIVDMLKSRMNPRYWQVLTDRQTLTIRQTAKKHGVCQTRIEQLLFEAKKEARWIMDGILTFNKCSDIRELY